MTTTELLDWYEANHSREELNTLLELLLTKREHN